MKREINKCIQREMRAKEVLWVCSFGLDIRERLDLTTENKKRGGTHTLASLQKRKRRDGSCDIAMGRLRGANISPSKEVELGQEFIGASRNHSTVELRPHKIGKGRRKGNHAQSTRTRGGWALKIPDTLAGGITEY